MQGIAPAFLNDNFMGFRKAGAMLIDNEIIVIAAIGLTLPCTDRWFQIDLQSQT